MIKPEFVKVDIARLQENVKRRIATINHERKLNQKDLRRIEELEKK